MSNRNAFISFLNFRTLFSVILPELNTSWPRRSGNRTYSSFLKSTFGEWSKTVETWKRIALEPMSMAASFNTFLRFDAKPVSAKLSKFAETWQLVYVPRLNPFLQIDHTFALVVHLKWEKRAGYNRKGTCKKWWRLNLHHLDIFKFRFLSLTLHCLSRKTEGWALWRLSILSLSAGVLC